MQADLINRTQQVLNDGSTKIYELVPKMVCKIIRDEAWKEQKNKEGEFFQSFQEFVEYRLWWGLGIPYSKLMRYCEDHEEATRMLKEQIGEASSHGGDRKSEAYSQDQVYNINLKKEKGTSPSYALRRLKRDRPDLAEKVVAGEMSANAAAIEAGFLTKTVSVPVDPERAARVLLKHFDPEELIDALERQGVATVAERLTR